MSDYDQLARKFEAVDDYIAEVRGRVIRLEDFSHARHIEHTALEASVENMLERQSASEGLLREIHADVLKSQGAVEALKEHRETTKDSDNAALSRKSLWIGAISLLLGSSLISEFIKYVLKGH